MHDIVTARPASPPTTPPTIAPVELCFGSNGADGVILAVGLPLGGVPFEVRLSLG